MKRIGSLVLVAALLPLAACARTYTTAGLGQYEQFQPTARSVGGRVNLELARGGYVAVVNVILPQPAYRERPVLFEAVYPLFETDQREFPAGEHRLVPRQESFRQPLFCTELEVPTLEGCRREFAQLPGVVTLSYYTLSSGIRAGHYIVIVADEPIDPYSIAEELFYLSLERPELAEALKALNAEAASDELEQALLDRPGPSNWAALYVAAQ